MNDYASYHNKRVIATDGDKNTWIGTYQGRTATGGYFFFECKKIIMNGDHILYQRKTDNSIWELYEGEGDYYKEKTRILYNISKMDLSEVEIKKVTSKFGSIGEMIAQTKDTETMDKYISYFNKRVIVTDDNKGKWIGTYQGRMDDGAYVLFDSRKQYLCAALCGSLDYIETTRSFPKITKMESIDREHEPFYHLIGKKVWATIINRSDFKAQDTVLRGIYRGRDENGDHVLSECERYTTETKKEIRKFSIIDKMVEVKIEVEVIDNYDYMKKQNEEPDKPYTTLDVRMSDSLKEEIEDLADEWGLSMSEAAMFMIKYYVEHGGEDD